MRLLICCLFLGGCLHMGPNCAYNPRSSQCLGTEAWIGELAKGLKEAEEQ